MTPRNIFVFPTPGSPTDDLLTSEVLSAAVAFDKSGSKIIVLHTAKGVRFAPFSSDNESYLATVGVALDKTLDEEPPSLTSTETSDFSSKLGARRRKDQTNPNAAKPQPN